MSANKPVKHRLEKILALAFLPFILFIIDFNIGWTERNVQFIHLVTAYCMSFAMIIHIWSHDSLRLRKIGLATCFDNENYRKLYSDYLRLADLNDKTYLYIVKFVFCLGWMLVTAFFVWFGYNCVGISKSLGGIYTLVLFTFNMFKNCDTYFSCASYVNFLYHISSNKNNKELKGYNYNLYLPGTTVGFQRLASNVRINAVCFLVISILQTVTFLLLLIINKSIVSIDNLTYVVAVIMVGVLCMATSLLIYIAPKILLRRILNKFIETSNVRLEQDLYRASKALDKYSQGSEMFSILELIKGLRHENKLYDKDIIEIAISLLAIAVNLLPFLAAIIK